MAELLLAGTRDLVCNQQIRFVRFGLGQAFFGKLHVDGGH